MHQVDEVREALDREFPAYSGRTGDWEDVLVRSLATEPKRRRRRSPLIVLAAAVVGVAVGALLWPGGDSSARILERARAVASDGPVVHLVLGPEAFPMTEVDLDTGKRRRLQDGHEQWFDPDRGVHDLHTIDGRTYRDVLYPAGSYPELEGQFAGLAAAYRKALESGKASVGGKGRVNGREVYWIRFHSRYPPFGLPLYDADHEVAVDAETFEPRLWRSRPTNESHPFQRATEVEIELWETLPAGSGDFTAAIDGNALPPENPIPPIRTVSRPVTVRSARSVLSPPAVWLGRRFRDLRLVRMSEQRAERLDTGAPAWGLPTLDLCYGSTRDACISDHPLVRDQPHVSISETNLRQRREFVWGSVFRPSDGTLIIPDSSPVPRPFRSVQGYARKDGVFVLMSASTEKLLVAAARGLKPIPRT